MNFSEPLEVQGKQSEVRRPLGPLNETAPGTEMHVRSPLQQANSLSNRIQA